MAKKKRNNQKAIQGSKTTTVEATPHAAIKDTIYDKVNSQKKDSCDDENEIFYDAESIIVETLPEIHNQKQDESFLRHPVSRAENAEHVNCRANIEGLPQKSGQDVQLVEECFRFEVRLDSEQKGMSIRDAISETQAHAPDVSIPFDSDVDDDFNDFVEADVNNPQVQSNLAQEKIHLDNIRQWIQGISITENIGDDDEISGELIKPLDLADLRAEVEYAWVYRCLLPLIVVFDRKLMEKFGERPLPRLRFEFEKSQFRRDVLAKISEEAKSH